MLSLWLWPNVANLFTYNLMEDGFKALNRSPSSFSMQWTATKSEIEAVEITPPGKWNPIHC